MLYIVILNMKRFLTDIEKYKTSPPLFEAGRTALRETVSALENYNLTSDITRCHRELICAAMDFSQKWETWIDNLGPGSLKHPATKVLHEFLLRFFKGMIKAWRIWRIDLTKQPQ